MTKPNSQRRIGELRDEIRKGIVEPQVLYQYVKRKEKELAVQRRRSNRIQRLEDHSGVWQNDARGIQDIAVNYFTSLFKFEVSSQGREVAGCVEKKVNDRDN